LNQFYRCIPVGAKLWPLLYSVRDEARTTSRQVLKNSIIAVHELVEEGPYVCETDLPPATASPAMVASRIHDWYISGQFWLLNFTTQLWFLPDSGRLRTDGTASVLRYYAMLRHEGTFPKNLWEGLADKKGFMKLDTGPEMELTGEATGEFTWRERSLLLPVCDQTTFAEDVTSVLKGLPSFKEYVKEPGYRQVYDVVREQFI